MPWKGTSLVVEWLKLPASAAEAMASTPGRETKILRGTAKKDFIKMPWNEVSEIKRAIEGPGGKETKEDGTRPRQAKAPGSPEGHN